MPVMSAEQILERVKELKSESGEKDEVIRDQQVQIQELEGKVKELEQQVEELKQAADSANALVEQLSAVLD